LRQFVPAPSSAALFALSSLNIASLHPQGVTERLTLRMIADLRSYWGADEGLQAQMVEDVGCSLCGAPCPPDILFAKERFPYRRCPECGLVYPSPRPRMSHIIEQYETGRFASTFEDMYLPSAPYRMATIFRERVEELIQPRVSSGRILDVGCSSGHFLKVAAEHGFEAYGIEPNPRMVRFAQQELGLSGVQCGTLAQDLFSERYFDVITMWDVLEHVEAPGALLSQARDILKPGGWLFAYTENFDSLNVYLTGSYSEMIVPDVHLRHYTPQTFRREVEQAGFELERVYTEGLDVAHVRKTYALFPEAFPTPFPEVDPDSEARVQSFISQVGKGDNLRIIARKPEN